MSESTPINAQSVQITPDEYLLAALAHGSVLLSFLGPIGPVLIWISQRRKSKYVSFQALQAMGYQMLFFWVGIAVWLVVAFLWICLMIPAIAATANNPHASESIPFAFEGGFFVMVFGFWGLYIVGGVAGAIFCLLKKDFLYPWLGKRLAGYLEYHPNSLIEMSDVKEEHWVGAMLHAAAILLMWGLVSPLAVWLTPKDRSPFLRFQALQALVYQSMAFLAYLGFMAFYFFSFILIMVSIPFIGTTHGASIGNSSFGAIITMVFFILMMLLWIVFLLAMPLYHLFAMIAGIQVMKGKDYHYPLLGNFIARRLNADQKAG